jgi:hypothetical protein
MKLHKSEKQKTDHLQPADFPPPNRVPQEKVSEICEWLGVSHRLAAEVKNNLDDLVDYVHESMSQKKAADRKGDRGRISNMLAQIEDTRRQLRGMSIDGRLAVRSTAKRLADILSGDWLRYHFPSEAPSKPMLGGRPPMRQPTRGTTNEDVIYFNYQFIRDQAPETLNALLRDLELGLASALTSFDSVPGARGGRQTLTHRHLVILNLANIWLRLGEKPVGTQGSNFAAFCAAIFEAIGWPTDGLESAIPDAIRSLRNRSKKRARLTK